MRFVLGVLLLSLSACSKANPTPPPAQAQAREEAQETGVPIKDRKEVDSPPPGALDGYRITGPYAHVNLSVFLFHVKNAPQDDLGCLTLEDALKSGAVKITEKAEGAEVNELQVENTGDKPVYLQAGDAVKGGKQDRTIAVDTILPPRSGKRSIDAFCVEPGRWTAREESRSGLAAATASVAFAEAPAPVATKEQKLAIRLDKSQDKVWAAGKKVNESLAKGGGGPLVGASFALDEPKNSYVLAIEDPAVQKRLTETLAVLEKAPSDQSDAVGAAFCVNGKVQNIEIYASAGLFRKLWPKLLRSSALEALSKQKDPENGKPAGEPEIRALLTGMSGQKGKAEIRPEGQIVRVFERDQSVLFDTEAGGKVVHRQLITK
jgi:hypothetical protein